MKRGFTVIAIIAFAYLAAGPATAEPESGAPGDGIQTVTCDMTPCMEKEAAPAIFIPCDSGPGQDCEEVSAETVRSPAGDSGTVSRKYKWARPGRHVPETQKPEKTGTIP